MKKAQWHMNRMGLIDFWYYVNEEFTFKDGHMLLRGSNGSGKSVTMQSFIPLLLDGNKSSERLDAFGTKSRRLETYLLEEGSNRDDRIGYLYLEFKKEGIEMYKTIGIGLHARRNKPLDAWYFVLEDNQRVNRDLSLMENHLAITKGVLKNRIGQKQYIDSQKEYMNRVNQALFGFPSQEEYKEAIQLLMQVRSPKLSNSLKPSIINELLSDSLQPLSEDDLRPMSEAISSMDEVEDQLQALKQSCESAKQIADIYKQYNYLQLEDKAGLYLETKTETEIINKQIKNIEKVIANDESEQKKGKEKLIQLKAEQEVLSKESESLKQQDFNGVLNELSRLENENEEKNNQKKTKENQKENKHDIWINAKNNSEKKAEQCEKDLDALQGMMNDLRQINDTIQFEEHISIEKEVLTQLEKEHDYTYTHACIQKEIELLDKGLTYFQKREGACQLRDHYIDEKEKEVQNAEHFQRKYEKSIKALEEETENQQERVYQWNAHNQVLKIDDANIKKICNEIDSYIEKGSYDRTEEIISNAYQTSFQRLVQTQSDITNNLNKIKEILDEEKDEYEHWLRMEDPTPQIDDDVKKNRKYLTDNRIPFVPLYTLLEFDESMNNKARNQFEEVLMRMGILNALVIEEKYHSFVLQQRLEMADLYLFTTKNISEISSYWISQKNTEIDIQDLFTALGIKCSEIEINEYGYRISGLNGTLSSQYKASFIGKKTRELLRQKKLEESVLKIDELSKKEKELREKIETITTNKELLKEEYQAFPKKDSLDKLKKEAESNESEITACQKRIISFDESIHKQQENISQFQHGISEIAKQLGINALQEAFENRKDDFAAYQKKLNDFEKKQQHYVSTYELYQLSKTQLELAEADLLTLRGEIDSLKISIQKNSHMIERLRIQLKESGYDEIINRIKEIEQRNRVINQLEEEENKEQGRREEAIKENREKLSQQYINISLQKEKEETAYSRYRQEAELYYVIDENAEIDHVEKILTEIKAQITTQKRKESLQNDLQQMFYSHRGNLQEYNLRIFSLFEDDVNAHRLDIDARYQGNKVSFGKLVEKLNESIETQKQLLEESDRHLIEDILINTISKKIKYQIQKSDAWVKTMNRYMNEMSTSSGFKLGLQWKSRKAETEDELNSEKLVELLSRDVRVLKESDYRLLSSHFKSKIATARKLSQQEESNESLHVIMKRIMDYRNWFEFKIMVEKTGEKKKEMTNNAFYSFSGGEKAMAMYVPLFSAVAAKFENAKEDAPMMITLDEAFAGMDDKNIASMFDLITKFGFDYIMNSQVLWGDYPNVKGLAIHELFRPENAKYVTVISYEWNGYRKRLVNV